MMKKNSLLALGLLALVLNLCFTACKNDGDDDPQTCDTVDVSYSATIAPILEDNCFNSCHSGSNPSSGFLLDSYAAVKTKVDEGRLYGAIAHQPGFSAMPQDGSKLPDCEISQIKAWIDAGAKDN